MADAKTSGKKINKTALLSLVPALLMPQIGITMLLTYAAKKVGTSIGRQAFKSCQSKAYKNTTSFSNITKNELSDNTFYVNSDNYDSIFKNSTTPGTAFYNNEPVNVSGLERQIDPVAFALYKIKTSLGGTGGLTKDEIKGIVSKQVSVKDKDKILVDVNLDKILAGLSADNIIKKDASGMFEIINPIVSRRYVFEGDEVKYLGSFRRNYSKISNANIELLKPSDYFTVNVTPANEKAVTGALNGLSKVIVSGGKEKTVPVAEIKPGMKAFIPTKGRFDVYNYLLNQKN